MKNGSTLVAIGVAILFVGLPISLFLGLFDPWEYEVDQMVLANITITLVIAAGSTAILVGFLLLALEKIRRK